MQELAKMNDQELRLLIMEGGKSFDCVYAEKILSIILERYYRINGVDFYRASKQEALVHLTFHMNKLVAKMVRYLHNADSHNAKIIKTEVVPDLVIYSVELAQKWTGARWIDWLGLRNGDSLNMLILDRSVTYISSFEEALLLTSETSYVISDICDRNDHAQTHAYTIDRDALKPICETIRFLCAEFSIDLQEAFFTRMNDMIAKYLSWH